MNKQISLLVIGLLFCLHAEAQESYIKKRWNFKLGYQKVATSLHSQGSENVNANGCSITGSYGFTRNIELGTKLGYATNSTYQFKSYDYSAHCNFHVLPYFIKTSDFRIDAYITGELGGILTNTTGINSNRMIYGAGLGLGIYPFKHWGIFGEYKWGKFHQTDQEFNFGICMKF